MSYGLQSINDLVEAEHKAGTLYIDEQNQLFMLMLAPDGYHLLRLSVSLIAPDKVTLADPTKIAWPLRLYIGAVRIQN